jgi:hypothetical protein
VLLFFVKDYLKTGRLFIYYQGETMTKKQVNLGTIFDTLRELLKKYEGTLQPKDDSESKYDLWSFKEIDISGRKKKDLSFATIILQSDYVGLYYMPIYTDKSVKQELKPELLSLLKGKSCFHIKKLDQQLLGQIEEALKIGFELYKKKGWI